MLRKPIFPRERLLYPLVYLNSSECRVSHNNDHNRILSDRQKRHTPPIKEEQQQCFHTAPKKAEEGANSLVNALPQQASPDSINTLNRKDCSYDADPIQSRPPNFASKSRHRSRHYSGYLTPTKSGRHSRRTSGRNDAVEQTQIIFSNYDHSYYGTPEDSCTYGSAGAVPQYDCNAYDNNYC